MNIIFHLAFLWFLDFASYSYCCFVTGFNILHVQVLHIGFIKICVWCKCGLWTW